MKKFISLILAAFMIFSLVACGEKSTDSAAATPEDGATETQTETGDEIIIGGLAPLTGDVSQYGVAVNNGVLLAVEDINAAGGVLGKQIKYIVEDEQGDPTQAINAYTKLYQSDNIIALVGDVTTKPTIAVAQKVAQDGLPMISASATGEDVTLAGENIFRACFIDPYQGELMAHYAFEKLGSKTAAILYDSGDDYSTGVAESFEQTAKELGMEVQNNEGYPPGTVDFNAQLTKIGESNPDVIMVPAYYEDVSKILVQARKLGIKSKFVGPDGWDGVLQKVEESSMDVLEDTYYCSQYSRQSEDENLQNFIKRYNEVYGIEENMFAVLGYDSMRMMAKAIENAGSTDSDAIIEAMKTLDYSGLTGTTKFDENRNPVREAYITTFENGESKVLETYSFA